MNDQRKASYQAALTVWREKMNAELWRKPSFAAFGLTAEEAADVEANGWSLEGLTDLLMPGKGLL